jgi:hypothetical protein
MRIQGFQGSRGQGEIKKIEYRIRNNECRRQPHNSALLQTSRSYAQAYHLNGLRVRPRALFEIRGLTSPPFFGEITRIFESFYCYDLIWNLKFQKNAQRAEPGLENSRPITVSLRPPSSCRSGPRVL